MLSTLQKSAVPYVMDQLHVTLGPRSLQISKDVILDMLYNATWDICVVKKTVDDEQGKKLELREQYPLGA